MQKLILNTANIRISQDALLIDNGEVVHAEIIVDENVECRYLAIPDGSTQMDRHFHLCENSHFEGSGIFSQAPTNVHIMTEIEGDNVHSNLRLLALVREDALFSVEGVAKVAKAYKKTVVRVDQTNILIGKKAQIRSVPRLEIATDDVSGGHSCKIHRLGGDVLFYLESRGLGRDHAEALLLNSEILKHLDAISSEEEKHQYCYQIHRNLQK